MPKLAIVDSETVLQETGASITRHRKAKPGEIEPQGEPEGWWAAKREPVEVDGMEDHQLVAAQLRKIEEDALELATRAASLREAIERMHEAREQVEALQHQYAGAEQTARRLLFGGAK